MGVQKRVKINAELGGGGLVQPTCKDVHLNTPTGIDNKVCCSTILNETLTKINKYKIIIKNCCIAVMCSATVTDKLEL